MLRGEVYWANLEPVIGRESNKVRPVVVVSNNAANAAATSTHGVVTVIPLTSSTSVVHPFQALVTITPIDGGAPVESKAQAEQVRTISTERIRARYGITSGEGLRAIDLALRVHLSL